MTMLILPDKKFKKALILKLPEHKNTLQKKKKSINFLLIDS